MNNRREIGIVYAYPTGDTSCFGVHPEDYTKLRDAWMAGQAFVEVRGFHGDSLTIKLKAIEAISYTTPENLRSEREETAANKAEDVVSGTD